MKTRNRMQQPYGYREQNKYVSEGNMICQAIIEGQGGSGSTVEKQIEEILADAFFGVEYDGNKKAFVFKNKDEEVIAEAPLSAILPSSLVKKSGYDSETKELTVTFDNDDVVTIPLDDLVELIDIEKAEREAADNEIWEAISGFTSGETIIEMIEQEIEDRISGDTALQEALDQEIEDRISGDTELQEAIEEEAAERASADTALQEALEKEIEDRISGDTALQEAIEEEAAERISADTALQEALEQETAERISGDTELQEAIEEEAAERESADTALQEAIEEEAAERASADTALQEAIEAETAERISADTALQEAIEEETAERTSADTALQEAIDAEAAERASGDTALQNAIDEEAAERESADTALQEALEQEIADRISADTALSTAVEEEAAAREAADAALQTAIEEEAAAREAADTAETAAREAKDAEIEAALAEEVAARQAADEALSEEIDANKVKMEKVTTGLDPNVREGYKLTNTAGEQLGEMIKVYKDSSLKDVELVDHYGSREGQFLKFTYILEDGTEKEEYLDVSIFLVEAEFKDGLKVNSAGEVSVKIDTASEEYLTVSSAGLKVEGIDAIKNDLDLEKLTRESKDALLEAAITQETAARLAADNELTNAISTETTARENADSALQTAINNEASTRQNEDTALGLQIAREQTAREDADQSLNRYITQVSNDLATETSNRSTADAALQTAINGLTTADVELNAKITTLQTQLTNETSARQNADMLLENTLATKANSVDVYYKTEADNKFATKEEIPTDFYSKSEVDAKDAAIAATVTDEANAREAADAELDDAITAETRARENADTALDTRIAALENAVPNKLEAVTAKDMSITVDNTNATRPAVGVNISTEEKQIVKLNADGIYAKAELEYDEEDNELVFINTTGSTSIKLKTQSQIDNIYYDKPNEEIVIEYTVNGQRKEDVKVPVGDLIEEWRTEDGNQGAIALTKTRNVQSEDVLSARLVLNTAHDDNAATIDANALYVSKNAIIGNLTTQIAALEARIAALEANLATETGRSTAQDTQHSSKISALESEYERILDIIESD